MLPIDTTKQFLENYSNSNTLRAYTKVLFELRATYRLFSESEYFEVHLLPKAINNYFKTLHADRKAKSTIARSINILHKYFQWAIDNGFIESNPMRSFEKIRLSFKDFTPAYLPDDFNLEMFLNRPDQFSFKGNNARMIIFLLSAFGLKRSEIINLKFGDLIDIESENAKLIIRSTKEFRTRVYDLEPEAVLEINGYLKRRLELSAYDLNEDDYLIQTSALNKSLRAIDGSTIFRTISRYLYTDEEKKINPSSFRLYKVLSSLYTRKYFELEHVYGMSHKEISKYKILDAKERIRKESEELIEEIVKARVKEEIKKLTG